MTQHDQLMEEFKRYAEVDPANLRPENRHLLEADFEALGKGATVDKKI